MSHRPTAAKKRRRVAKALRRQPLQSWIDPVAWLVDHGHAKTKREARELVLAGRLKSESHTVGIGEGLVQVNDGLGASILKPGKIAILIPATLRSSLRVEAA